MSNIQPYNISIPESEIDTLNQKLSLARFPESSDDDWERGTPAADLRRISQYWREEFNWKSYEERLNQLPHYEATVSVDGFDPFQMHFIHQRSEAQDAIPLLFIHGWPGGFFEAFKILPLLAESEKNGGPAFHVVVPSLPNFGFSERVGKPGFGIAQYAEACHKLMLGLGYEKFAAQGGDWGSAIGLKFAALYPESLRTLHLNLIIAPPPPPSSPIAYIQHLVTHFLNLYTPQEVASLKAGKDYQANGSGYFLIQKTRPNTIGAALADSPVGLLAWIYDKLVSWTDDYQWTDQEICEWVSVYWFSRAGPAASVVIYHEANKANWRPVTAATEVKMGFSYFPKELFGTPRAWNRRLGDVVFEHEHERGGHFAAWERPEELVGDLRVLLSPGGGAHNAVRASKDK